MNKEKLDNRTKEILIAIKNENYNYMPSDGSKLARLLELYFIVDESTKDGPYYEISQNGLAYFDYNPNLDNPSVFDDKKFVISTSISCVAILISIISLIVAILK